MIDDAALEAMILSAGEAIEVPADGPDRVLAARDALSGGRPRESRPGAVARWGRQRPRVLVAVSVAAALIAVIAGISFGAQHHVPGASTRAGTAFEPVAAPPRAGALGASGSNSGAADGPASSGASGSAGSPDEVPALPSKVVKTGSVSLQVDSGHLSETVTALTSDAVGLGGFVASSSETTGASSTPSGATTLRVPVAGFETLVGEVQRLGTATAVTITGNDVTAQYVDLQARIQALEDTRSQFEQILAKAQTIGDILSVEQQIGSLQGQIEQLQGQQQVLDDQATYSTLSVTVTEKAESGAPTATHTSGVSRSWAHARNSFAHGIEAVIAASGGLAVFLVFLVFAAIVCRLAWLAWVYLRRRLI